MILVFDTETTGLLKSGLPPEHPEQPRIVQMAALLCDDDCNERGMFSSIIQPDGFIIPQGASAVHGITNEIADLFGIPLVVALQHFQALLDAAGTVICHNYGYDSKVMHGELSRMWQPLHIFLNRPHFCTMLALTPVCKIPGRMGDYKWPKLTEAYQSIFNEVLTGAHGALADCRATLRLYKWLKQQPQPKEAA